MTEKPHNGKIRNWCKYEAPGRGLGYLILGEFVGHHQFDGEDGHTSYVVAHDEATGEIETKNSGYTLIGQPRA